MSDDKNEDVQSPRAIDVFDSPKVDEATTKQVNQQLDAAAEALAGRELEPAEKASVTVYEQAAELGHRVGLAATSADPENAAKDLGLQDIVDACAGPAVPALTEVEEAAAKLPSGVAQSTELRPEQEGNEPGLFERVDKLEAESRAAESSLAELRPRVEALEKQAVSGTGPDRAEIAQIVQVLDTFEKRLSALESNAAHHGITGPRT